MSTLDPAIMAKNLAKYHIRSDVDSGISEHRISLSWSGSGRSHKHWKDAKDGFGGYQVSIGGYYDKDPATGLFRKRVNNDKILVTEVYGIEGVWIFSLHEIFKECQNNQVSLI